MDESRKEVLLAVLALISFAAKLSANIAFLGDVYNTFATYVTDLTPGGSPLLLVRILFVLPYSLVLVLFCMATTFRGKHGSRIIGSKFFISLSVSCVLETVHMWVWAYSWTLVGFILICATVFCQCATLYETFTGLHIAKLKADGLGASRIWCHRIFVQSSLVFDCTWNSILMILDLTVVLCYDVGLSSFEASVIGLVIFTVGLLIWFLIENLVVEKYVRFAGVEYVAVSIALTSLLTSDRLNGSALPVALLSLMAVVLILLFLRMFVIICLESRRKSRNQLYTMVQI